LAFSAAFNPNSGVIDVDQMLNTINKTLAQMDTSTFNVPAMLFFFSWLSSMVDAFFIGSRIDKKNDTVPPLPDGRMF
jgi:hypothetical protein